MHVVVLEMKLALSNCHSCAPAVVEIGTYIIVVGGLLLLLLLLFAVVGRVTQLIAAVYCT